VCREIEFNNILQNEISLGMNMDKEVVYQTFGGGDILDRSDITFDYCKLQQMICNNID
jgi:hypothetical protein